MKNSTLSKTLTRCDVAATDQLIIIIIVTSIGSNRGEAI